VLSGSRYLYRNLQSFVNTFIQMAGNFETIFLFAKCTDEMGGLPFRFYVCISIVLHVAIFYNLVSCCRVLYKQKPRKFGKSLLPHPVPLKRKRQMVLTLYSARGHLHDTIGHDMNSPLLKGSVLSSSITIPNPLR
jgi:hypothetical protein